MNVLFLRQLLFIRKRQPGKTGVLYMLYRIIGVKFAVQTTGEVKPFILTINEERFWYVIRIHDYVKRKLLCKSHKMNYREAEDNMLEIMNNSIFFETEPEDELPSVLIAERLDSVGFTAMRAIFSLKSLVYQPSNLPKEYLVIDNDDEEDARALHEDEMEENEYAIESLKEVRF